MIFRPRNTGLIRGLLALSVSLAVVTSSYVFVFASPVKSNNSKQVEPQGDEGMSAASAWLTEAGVKIEWSSSFDPDNLGFNVYRQKGWKRTRINREIIPGSVFVASPNDPQNVLVRGSRSYAWLDPAGTRDSTYFVESVSLHGVSRLHRPLTPNKAPGNQLPPIHTGSTQTSEIASADTGSFETSYPAGYPAGNSATASAHMTASTLEDQWNIAAQPGVKIAIKKDGWYRVTQPQMAAAGFNPSVDVTNLQLFADGQEVAISTSQSGGLFGPSDYFEFFGRGLDVPTSDVRTYYLIAGTSPGKRVRGELQIDSPPSPTPTPMPSPAGGSVAKPTWSTWVLRRLTISPGHPIGMPFMPMILWREDAQPTKSPERSPVNAAESSSNEATRTEPAETLAAPAESKPAVEKAVTPKPLKKPAISSAARLASAVKVDNEVAVPPAVPQVVRQKKTSRKKSKKHRFKRQRSEPRREYSHAVGAASVAPTYFQSTVERKDRGVYFSSLLNGDEENWFGQVITFNPTPTSVTINTPNPDTSAPGTVRLEIKLQGVNFVQHQVNVTFNDVAVGTPSFFGHDHPVHIFNIPLSLLQDGTNTLKFSPLAGPDTSIVDYVRITYPHRFRADADSLKFSLLGTQTLTVDGFSNPNVQLIEYTDPFNVSLTKPVIESSGGEYEITVPPSSPKSKTARLFFANATAPQQPAAISLNQPSTWNLSTNAADFVIITSSNLIPSLAPLVSAREAQGRTVEVVNVEDVYDEFGYGLHGPQAIKDFLERANTAWALPKPLYVIFAGDASFDPRNYSGLGNFDLVPTKLVDATYNETASDEWLADFDENGIADIAIGRLPLRTPAEMDLVISKIINFTPVTVPQGGLLVADAQGSYYFSFEAANDEVGEIIDPALTVQKVVRQLAAPGCIPTPPFTSCQTELDAATTAAIINNMNQGQAVINYSGHGNVDVWTGGEVFRAFNATALTNGLDKLFLVVVMDCLNGYFQDPQLLSMSEAFIKAPNGGAVAAFASSGLTLPDGQHAMSMQLYSLLYGSQPIALGDAIKIAKGATGDIDVRHTWIFFGDPSMKIR